MDLTCADYCLAWLVVFLVNSQSRSSHQQKACWVGLMNFARLLLTPPERYMAYPQKSSDIRHVGAKDLWAEPDNFFHAFKVGPEHAPEHVTMIFPIIDAMEAKISLQLVSCMLNMQQFVRVQK